MTTKTTTAIPKSDAFAAIHSAAQGLHRAGAITKTTMSEYDALLELMDRPEQDNKGLKDLFARQAPWDK